MTEKIRQLTNKVTLAGALVELKDVREGETKAGIPYISFNGVIQCGESQVSRLRFKTFVKSKKADGSDSKNFVAVKKWAKNAVPMTENESNPTMVEAIGSLTDHPYVNKEGKLVEATEFSLQFFGDFSEYKADVDMEGFVHSFKDETKGEDETPTGRQRMRLISRDIFGNMLDFKSIVIPEELVDPIADNGYEKGSTAKFFLSLIPNQKVTSNKSGGIGTQRVEGGKPYLEWVLTGAEPVIDSESEQALDAKLVKAAMVERQSHLNEIQEAGYLGNKNDNASNSTASGAARKSIGTVSKKVEDVVVEDIADDDFPF